MTTPELAVHRFPGERPVLLVHGLHRSTKLDWIDPGWPEALADAGRGTVGVDLPGHGDSPAAARGTIPPSAIVAAMVDAIAATGQEQADVVSYSLGARLAWTLAATGRVRRLVLGGFSTRKRPDVDIDVLGAVTRGEVEPPDPTIGMLAGMITSNGVDTVTALWLIEGLQAEAFDAAVDVPTVPTLIVCGTDDGAAELEPVAAGIPTATLLPVPGDHGGALMSPEFRTAAIEFVTG